MKNTKKKKQNDEYLKYKVKYKYIFYINNHKIINETELKNITFNINNNFREIFMYFARKGMFNKREKERKGKGTV